MRQTLFLTAALSALGAGLILAAPASAAPQDGDVLTPVQYYRDWGPRSYEPDIEPYRPRRWATPDDDDEDIGLIAPQRVMAIARSMGHRPIARPRLSGRAWVVDAVGPRGQRTRLTINAYSGAPIAIRDLEPAGERPPPPTWRDERPSYGRDTPPQQPDAFREGRLDNDPMRPEGRIDRQQRPAPAITARAVPVPMPRPNIDGTRPLSVEPTVPFTPPPGAPQTAVPPAEPPSAALPPRQVAPRRVGPAPAPLPAEPPPAAAVPEPAPPAAALPQAPPPVVEPPAVIPPAAVPAVPIPPATMPPAAEPPAAAVQPETTPQPNAPTEAAPVPSVPPVEPPAAVAPPAEPAPVESAAPPAPSTETAQTPAPAESGGVMIDGRFLGPNGEALPSGPGQPATPGVRQVTPPPAGN